MYIIRKTLLSLAILSFCFCMAIFFDVHPLDASPQAQPAEEEVTLPLDENDFITMDRLLEFASETLGISLLYDEEETMPQIYMFTGQVRVPRSKFLGYFERLLLEKNFILLSTGEGQSAMHRVYHYHPSGGRMQPVQYKAKVVALADLQEYADRGCLITFSIPLKHLDSRSTLQSLNPYFIASGNQVLQSIRCVENANSLIITTFGQKACQLYRLIQEMDAIATEEMKFKSEWLKQLEARIAVLEDKVKKLKQ